MKKIVVSMVVLLSFFEMNAQQLVEPSKVGWYSIEEAMEKYEKEPRPLLIDVYTDWCGWCTHMMKTTFANEQIAQYLNNNFYPVRYDAETLDTIRYKNKTYTNKGQGSNPKHELAYELLDGRFSFPTLVFFDKRGVKLNIPGYLNVTDFEPLMYYFAEEINVTTPYQEQYEKFFRATFSQRGDTTYKEMLKSVDTLGVVKWHSFEEVMELMKTEKKKIFIHIDAGWRVGGRIMLQTTYKNKPIADYMNKNYYAINFNALSTDTIQAFGGAFVNEQKRHPFHNLAVDMLVGKMLFPATLILNEDMQLVNRLQEYLSPQLIEPILKYYGDNAYKQKSWDDFAKEFKSGIK